MKNIFYGIRNKVSAFLYAAVFKKIFFMADPETVHEKITGIGKFLGHCSFTRRIAALLFSYSNRKLKQDILGITFHNPIGLAAGFDKDARLTDIIPSIGFGFAEVGSITGEPCAGNPKPRLWRLKKSKGLVVYYGLKNDGCEKIADRLRNKAFKIRVGTNIAKTNSEKTVDLNEGIKDYLKAYEAFADIGAYFTINISCPNAFGGQPFTNPESLDALLVKIGKVPTKKPVFLKMSPDLSHKEIDGIIKVSERHGIAGFICANLTKNRNNEKIIDKIVPEKGGISGKVVEDLSNNLISYLYRETKGKFVIIGCGGVFSGMDAYKKIRAGASLIQLMTGMIFNGPQVIGEINKDLVSLLEKDGFDNISQAIGGDFDA